MKISRFTKAVVLINGLIPVTLLGWDALVGELGANPANFAIRTTGMLSLIFLLLSLAISPASKISHLPWLIQFRRSAGLYAFFHTVLHFLLFFLLDRAGNIGDTLSEMWLRPYLTVGIFGLVLMLPLAVTSTDAMIRRLGPNRWRRLHRLAYLAGIAAVVHFYMLVKADTFRPNIAIALLGVLFAYRLIVHYSKVWSESATLKSQPLQIPPKTSVESNNLVPLPEPSPNFSGVTLEFVRSGKVVPAVKGRTILEIAEDHNIDLPYGCRSGVCGQCKIQKLSGDVEMESQDSLEPSEVAEQIILACQAQCLGNVRVDA